MLEAGFRQVQSMITMGRIGEIIQEARNVIAYNQKIRPDQVKSSDKQICEWIQNTIHGVGRRVRHHHKQAKRLLSGDR